MGTSSDYEGVGRMQCERESLSSLWDLGDAALSSCYHGTVWMKMLRTQGKY